MRGTTMKTPSRKIARVLAMLALGGCLLQTGSCLLDTSANVVGSVILTYVYDVVQTIIMNLLYL
jgi:hypothetical protein